METLYCPRCDAMLSYDIRNVEETYSVRGEEITIEAQVAFCCECSESIFHEELDGRNLERLYAIYRRRKGILSPNKIRD